ncbi:MAG TPA: hypothetical protein VE131_14930, partial [Terriglobales bacterium]|nr:hypothetical protein [Terriglobales bacterium]
MKLCRVNQLAGFLTQAFVAWVLLAALAALVWPAGFIWFQPYIVPGLGLIMFGMGMALTPADFKRVAEQPYAIGVGLAAQFLIMPLAAAGISKVF